MKKILILLLLFYSLSNALITSGTLTFGVGGTYGAQGGLVAAVAAIAIGTPTTGNILISAVGKDTETASSSLLSIQIGAGYNITIDLGGNVLYLNNGNLYCLIMGSSWVTGTQYLQNGTMDMINSGGGYSMVTINGAITQVVRNIQFRCHGQNFGAVRQNSTGIGLIYNCIADSVTYGYINVVGNTSTVLENCTFLNCVEAVYNYDGTAYAVKNCAIFNSTTASFVYGAGPTNGLGNTIMTNCATSDAYGTYNGLTLVNELMTRNPASKSYCYPIHGGSCATHGTAPTIAGHTTDYNGSAVPGGAGTYSIGATQYNPLINVKSKDSTASTYTMNCSLSVFADSGTVVLQDSIKTGTWGTRGTTGEVYGGEAFCVTRTGLTASTPYYTREYITTNTGAKDTTAVSSVTTKATSGGAKHGWWFGWHFGW